MVFFSKKEWSRPIHNIFLVKICANSCTNIFQVKYNLKHIHKYKIQYNGKEKISIKHYTIQTKSCAQPCGPIPNIVDPQHWCYSETLKIVLRFRQIRRYLIKRCCVIRNTVFPVIKTAAKGPRRPWTLIITIRY